MNALLHCLARGFDILIVLGTALVLLWLCFGQDPAPRESDHSGTL